MIDLSPQQREIVESPFKSTAVIACAGSGKTATAVRRLAAIRKRLDDKHGQVALLSFSNVAVNTFNEDYNALVQEETGDRRKDGIEIATVDSFITTNIIRPHGHLVMGCNRTPFLVDGSEPFLTNFTVGSGKNTRPTTDLQLTKNSEGKYQFTVGKGNALVDPKVANQAIKKLAKVGAYSHTLGSLWAWKVLKTKSLITRALVRRYPHILIDEAQDIGTLHEAVLLTLREAGAQISLIGDVNQGIYEFSGAAGTFLEQYGDRKDVESKSLETNFRSVPSIVTIANKLSERTDVPQRPEPETLSGAYYFVYKTAGKDSALKSFAALLGQAGIAISDAAVLCRSKDWVRDWVGGEEEQGQGVLRQFVNAAIQRDKFSCFDDAFKCCCSGIVGLLENEHGDVLSDLVRGGGDGRSSQMLRRTLWSFVKDASKGLPSASLVADTEWQPALLKRLEALLDTLSVDHGLKTRDKWKAKLAKRKILNQPLIKEADLGGEELPKFRVSTVHKVKGESISGVLYICSRSHLNEFLGGTTTEVGRIGYVALTRARDLFVLGVPATNQKEFAPKLEALGFKKAGEV